MSELIYAKYKQFKFSGRYVMMLELEKCSCFERNVTFVFEKHTEKYKTVYNSISNFIF